MVSGPPLRRLRLSLRNRLALGFFAITLVAIGGLYLYIAPGLRSRLMRAELRSLQTAAVHDSRAIRRSVGSSVPARTVRQRVARAAASSGDQVTLLSVQTVQGAAQLSVQDDSSNPAAGAPSPRPALAYTAVARRRPATGTVSTPAGMIGEAAVPVLYHGQPAAVIVFSTPVGGILRTVSTVRREILLAGVIVLALALAAAYLVAGALGRRVRQLELAARRVASGEFGQPLPVDSSDEVGRLAAAFNEMQLQLEQLERARKKFIATASHELRTPLFSLGGFLELLEDDELDPDTRRRFLDQVREQVDRLGKLSVDLLDLSRLEAGALELRPEEVDLRELTRSVSGEFEPVLAQHDGRLELRLGSGRLEALCDPVRVAQIMRILIDNALVHTPSGTEVVVTAGRENGLVRLTVRDDGEGIEAQALPRIFEPFYTADDTQGSGLGLAIASELAARMEGRLTVRSEPGETEFTLELPA